MLAGQLGDSDKLQRSGKRKDACALFTAFIHIQNRGDFTKTD